MSDTSMTMDSTMSMQNRKFAKTCVEKKRRDRINRCLDELKTLMSNADDKARYQKMEKAEILEMAVGFMKNACRQPRQQQQTITTDNHNDSYLMAAYKQCFADFQHYLTEINIDNETKMNMLNKLNQRFTLAISQQRFAAQISNQHVAKKQQRFDEFADESRTSTPHTTTTTTDDSSFSSSSTCSSPVSTTSSYNLNDSKMWRPW